MKTTVHLSLGSNLGEREANLHEALRRLRALGTVVSISSLYETEPVEVLSRQAWFLNCAAQMETDLTAEAFLQQALAIEQAMGRQRTEPKGPRTIDIDILFFGSAVIDTPELTVPHPGLPHRRFVLEPLAEIAPEFIHPVLKQTVQEMLALLPASSGAVRRFPAN